MKGNLSADVVKAVKHSMRIASSRGDDPVTWDVADRVSVESAAEQFERLVNERTGAQAFGWMPGEAEGQVIDKFNPELERIAILPRAAGG